MSDAPDQNGFVAGRDQAFEDIIIEERQEKEKDTANDNDSLTITSAGHEESSVIGEAEEIEEEEEEEEPPAPKQTFVIMPPNAKLNSIKEPSKHPNQCAVSWEALRPVIGYVNADDPDMKRRNASLTRKAVCVRVDIPAGVNPGSWKAEVSPDGKKIIFSCHLEKSRFSTDYIMNRNLIKKKEIKMAMELALGKSWSYIKQKCEQGSDGGDAMEYKRYTLSLPEPCEREFRNVAEDWELFAVGDSGYTMDCVYARSMFFYCFLFTEKSKEITPARASMNKLMYMEQSFDQDPMGATNLARTYFLNQQQMNMGSMKPLRKSEKKKKKKRKSRRRKSRSRKRKKKRYESSSSESSSSESSSSDESEDENLTRSFRSMDISSNGGSSISTKGQKKEAPQLPSPVRSRGETRSRENKTTDDYLETESQNRNRLRGKQMRMTELATQRLMREMDGMGAESLARREREMDELMRQCEEDLLNIPSEVKTTSKTPSTERNDQPPPPPPPPPLSNVVNPDDDSYPANRTRATRSAARSRTHSEAHHSEGSGSL